MNKREIQNFARLHVAGWIQQNLDSGAGLHWKEFYGLSDEEVASVEQEITILRERIELGMWI